jgi:alpha-ketoglutaric semialdehyde dehydrogenase
MTSINGSQILGQQLSSQGAEVFYSEQGSTGRKLEPEFRNATAAEVQQAVLLAHQAKTTWSKAAPSTRATFLRQISSKVDKHRETLIQRATLETGYSEPRLTMELNRSLQQLEIFARFIEEGSWVDAIIDRGDPHHPAMPQPEIRRMLHPLGPVGVFGASNFPFAISVIGNDAVAAWSAGCPVVVKAHPGHPGTCELLGHCVRQVIHELGLPEGLFSLLQGKQHRVGEELVQHPHIRAIGFTGSLKGGQVLWQLAQRRPDPIPFFAELGSLNPVLIFPSAIRDDPQHLSQGLIQSLSFGQGQMCTRPGFAFFVDSPDAQSWKTELSKAAANFDVSPLLTTGTFEHFSRTLTHYQTDLGARQIHPASSTGNVDPARVSLHLLEVEAQEILDRGAQWQECFGPACVLVSCENMNQLKRIVDTLPGGLTLTVHADERDGSEILEWLLDWQTKFGRLVWNQFPTGVRIGEATHHGGPYPASFDGQGTAIGTRSISRFTRPTCYQNFPESLLPEELQSDNPRGIWRKVDGQMTQAGLED